MEYLQLHSFVILDDDTHKGQKGQIAAWIYDEYDEERIGIAVRLDSGEYIQAMPWDLKPALLN